MIGRRRSRVRARAFPLAALVLVGLVGVACGGSTPPSAETGPVVAGSSTAESPTTRRPLLIDTDLGLDDLMAIAFLAREPSVEIRAITVAGTGLVHCAPGLRTLRDLLGTLDASPVPIGCGRDRPGNGGHAFPDPWRARADDAYGLDLAPVAGTEAGGDAPTIIGSVARAASGPLTILALAPLTNIADALDADPGLAGRLDSVHLMGGALRVPGNAVPEGPDPGASVAEWNLYADPSAAARVIGSGLRIGMVPLDATDVVPLGSAFAERLATDVTSAGADLANELLVRNPPLDGQSFWDQLAAAALVEPSVVTDEQADVRVITDGPEAGRLVIDPNGAKVTIATGADRAAFESRFIAGLRRGTARVDPLPLDGEIGVTFDGTTCHLDTAGPTVGTFRLTFRNESTAPAGVTLATVRPPKTWDDAIAYVRSVDPTAGQLVDWIKPLASVNADAGSSASALVDIGPGIVGAACLDGTWPMVRFHLTGAVDVAP